MKKIVIALFLGASIVLLGDSNTNSEEKKPFHGGEKRPVNPGRKVSPEKKLCSELEYLPLVQKLSPDLMEKQVAYRGKNSAYLSIKQGELSLVICRVWGPLNFVKDIILNVDPSGKVTKVWETESLQIWKTLGEDKNKTAVIEQVWREVAFTTSENKPMGKKLSIQNALSTDALSFKHLVIARYEKKDNGGFPYLDPIRSLKLNFSPDEMINIELKNITALSEN